MSTTGGPARAGAWRSGLRQFVLKIHSRCNLACDYCYVYEGADQSWRAKPVTMGPAVIDRTAARIGEHVAVHRPPWVEIVLHGGEPLLAGAGTVEHVVAAVRAAVGTSTMARFVVQTNGVLLTEPVLTALDRLGVGVAVSVDGGEADQDRHRRFHGGRSSHAAVTAGLELLSSPRHRHQFVGLLSVVDLDADPLAVYQALAAWHPPTVDLLLPHRTWADPPPTGARYGTWLAAVFDAWYPGSRTMGIRIFDEIIAVLLGARTATTAIGAGPVQHVTVESDGTIEADDILKVAYSGAPATGLDTEHHSFDDYLASPALADRQAGVAALSSQCRACEIVQVCGGGSYSHRYRPGSGFDNPSAYCDDLKMLIGHVRTAILADLGDGEPRTRRPQPEVWAACFRRQAV